MPVDFPAREKFVCVLFSDVLIISLSSFLFTDKAHLNRDGVINIHNKH
jgi:hypothetical protein